MGTLLALAVGGCSMLLASEDQCVVDQDCADRGYSSFLCRSNVCVDCQKDCVEQGFSSQICRDRICVPGGGDWICLTEPTKPLRNETFKLRLQFYDFISAPNKIPIDTVDARVCNLLDFECENPVPNAAKKLSEGTWEFTLNRSFFGYVEATSPDTMPYIVILNPNTYDAHGRLGNDDNVLWTQVGMLSPAMVTLVAGLIGTPIDPAMGQVFGETRDCAARVAAGVASELAEGGGTPITIRHDNTPSLKELETDQVGIFGQLNVKPGFHELVGLLGVDGPSYGRHSIIVRKGHVTTLFLSPAIRQ
jgi:hypothetical protein